MHQQAVRIAPRLCAASTCMRVLLTTAIVVYSTGRHLLESLISIALGQTRRIDGVASGTEGGPPGEGG